MAVQKINYQDKVALNENASIADINKVTDDDMNEIKDVVNNNANETEGNTTNISNLKGEILWTNSNPTNDFAAQTIQINNLSKYKYIDIIFFAFKLSTTQFTHRIYYDSNSNYNVSDVFNCFKYNNKAYIGTRRVWVYANSIQFEDNSIIKGAPSNAGADLQSDTTWTIPYRVIGYEYNNTN